MGGPGRKRKKEAQQVRSVSQRQQRAAPRRAASGALAPEVGKVKRRVRKKFKLFSARGGVDRPLFYLILVLLVIGLIMLFSASYAYSYYYFDNSYHFITPQALFAVFGLVLMGLISLFDYHHLHKFAFPLFFITLGLLVAVKVLAGTSIAPILNGANRWLYIGPVNFQPSEVAKFALVLIFAHLISINYHNMGTFRYGVLPYLIILLMIAGLILVENHVSATLIILAIAAVMLFIGGASMKHLFGLGMLMIPLFLVLAKVQPYRWARLTIFTDPWKDPLGSGYQLIQSLYALGNGGLFGKGLNFSTQKLRFLTYGESDFIFSIIGEELGFVGCVLLMGAYFFVIWRGVRIAARCKDRFGSLLAGGITLVLALQVAVNIGVATSSVPPTGQTLPFISAGGTSLITMFAAMGAVSSVKTRTLPSWLRDRSQL